MKRTIADGLCYEIAVEANRFFKPDGLKEAMRESGLDRDEVAAFCAACANFPLERRRPP